MTLSHHRTVFLAPPASGKGTAAKEFIDKGQLVPDEITMEIVRLWPDEHGRGRLSCENRRALYHHRFVRSRRPGHYDTDGGKLAQRADGSQTKDKALADIVGVLES